MNGFRALLGALVLVSVLALPKQSTANHTVTKCMPSEPPVCIEVPGFHKSESDSTPPSRPIEPAPSPQPRREPKKENQGGVIIEKKK
jgi:hypothetical protein